MSSKIESMSPRQFAFQELFVGTLIYAVVLGFFNDYTTIVSARSFSTIFFASFVLEILTYLAFQLKGSIVARLKNRHGLSYRILMFFCVWLVMFLSKFIFLWALDSLFDDYIIINGFFGILFIVLCVTIVQRLANKIFVLLGDHK